MGWLEKLLVMMPRFDFDWSLQMVQDETVKHLMYVAVPVPKTVCGFGFF